VLPIAVLIGILPCGFVLASVASDADGGRNGWPFTRGYVYCDKEKKCYHSNPYGGWGLEPKRTYKLDYDGGPACKVIKDALNNAIKIGKKSEENVIFPTPRYPEFETPEDAKLEKDIDGREFRYYAQNPLFSDPIFLKWKFLGGYPDKDFPEMRGKYGYDETAWAHRHDIHDTFPKRWLIVPYKNDGRPYLLTAWVWGNGTTVGVEPPKVFNVWDISSADIKSIDWNLSKSYASHSPVVVQRDAPEKWLKDPHFYSLTHASPIELILRLNLPMEQVGCQGGAYPKMTEMLKRTQKNNLWNTLCMRDAQTMQIANVDGRNYLVFPDWKDRILVVDAGKAPGDDECYLSSNISGKTGVDVK